MRPRIVSLLLVAQFFVSAQPGAMAQACAFELCTPGVNGAVSSSSSTDPVLSGDGRFVVFESWSDNLVPGDTNGWQDVFRFDRQTGDMLRASVSTGGGQSNQRSDDPAVSGDGQWIAFASGANLDPADTGLDHDIYLHDTATTTTFWVSRGMGGVEPDNSSDAPVVSGDGRFVAFESWAGNLVPGDTNNHVDIFVYEIATGLVERVSVASDGSQAVQGDSRVPDISADSRFVAFTSQATNLVPGGDLNGGDPDVFVHDRLTGQTTLVSLDQNGNQPVPGWAQLPSISYDGRHVAYQDFSGIFLPGTMFQQGQILVHDRLLKQTTIASADSAGTPGNDCSYGCSISDDGRFVTFASDATNLIPLDTNGEDDVFLHDRLLGTTRRVSETAAGVGGNQESRFPGISADGRVVAFYSGTTNLVPGTQGLWSEILVSDCGVPAPASYCPAGANSKGCLPSLSWSGVPSASAGGGFVLTGTQLINNKVGVLCYSVTGWSPKPYFGGTLCLEAPLGRALLTKTGGTVGPADCSGTLTTDFNAFVASGADPALVAGQAVHAQFVSRDPASVGTLSLTDAVVFTLEP